LRDEPGGGAFLDRLPALIDELAERWSVRPGEPFPYAFASIALPVVRADGSEAVLKVSFPGREAEHEAEALKVWGGRGAVRLLDHDPERWALLLERCLPGTSLASLPQDEAIDVAVDLLPRLWVPAGAPFRPLAEEAAWWASYLPGHWDSTGRPFERELLDAALEAITDLSGSQGEQVLVNQDLHADNVLRARREPWLVIDPKPLAGERAFGIAALVRGSELGASRSNVVHRLDRLTAELGLDQERARRWCLAQTLAWGVDEDEVMPGLVEVARWLARANG
jgi:streptomycin 6-kinase